jgi:hypothetical protein
MPTLQSRRAWLRSALGLLALLAPSRAFALHRPPHPTPRKGITGDKVATAAMLSAAPYLTELFDGVRAIPHVVDGIRCHCGCADADGHYSLLTCYEGASAMAMVCPICQGEGRVAVRMAKAGRSLDDIRIAIDAQFG